MIVYLPIRPAHVAHVALGCARLHVANNFDFDFDQLYHVTTFYSLDWSQNCCCINVTNVFHSQVSILTWNRLFWLIGLRSYLLRPLHSKTASIYPMYLPTCQFIYIINSVELRLFAPTADSSDSINLLQYNLTLVWSELTCEPSTYQLVHCIHNAITHLNHNYTSPWPTNLFAHFHHVNNT